MQSAESINPYSQLLKIRLSAFRRNTILTGSIFLLSVISALAWGLLSGLSGRSVYIIIALNLAFAFSFIFSWVRLEIVKSLIELVDHLQS